MKGNKREGKKVQEIKSNENKFKLVKVGKRDKFLIIKYTKYCF